MASSLSRNQLRQLKVLEAFNVLEQWRAAHLESFKSVMDAVTTLLLLEPTGAIELGSRYPKRSARMVEKLVQHESGLERIQDIAGIRIVVTGGLDAQQQLVTRLRARFPHARIKDYVTRARATGYRAVHVIVEMRLPVEIQVRTEQQHRWAEAVEEAESRMDIPLKDGNGPRDLLDYFRTASIIALQESGSDADPLLTRELDELRERVRHYFRRPDTA